MVRVGVAGVGHLGKIHAKLWKVLAGVEVVAIFDANEETAEAVGHDLELPVARSIADLLERVDALSIVTTTSQHFEVAIEAIDRGKHVLVEKPITSTTDQAEQLVRAAKKRGVTLQVGHIERFNPALLAVEKYLDDPRFFESHRMAQFKPRGTDVPVVLDLMVHDIDVILSLVKAPVKSIDASGVAVVSDQLDIANARIKFENGAVANVTSSRISQNPMRKLRVFERSAYLSIDFAAKSADVFRLMDPDEAEKMTTPMMMLLGEIEQAHRPKSIIYEKPEVQDLNPLRYELELFVHAIKHGTRPVVSGEDGLEALRVAEEIVRSIEIDQG